MKTTILELTPDNAVLVATQAWSVLRAGGLIIYPTDTIYGIGADATNEHAVDRVYEIKEREKGKPLLILASSFEMVNLYTKPISSFAQRVLETYWPGAVTFIFPANDALPENVAGETGTIGIRIPDNQFCLELISELQKPIISTSANISGKKGGSRVDALIETFDGKVELIISAGDVDHPIPSTLVDISGPVPKVLRQGARIVDLDSVQ
jgi:L-threonylcarbamoyladenylate synthase